MKESERKIICELIKNSRESDREIAKVVGVSQPTVTRTRKRLEDEGLIQYVGIPNLTKMGYEIMAFMFASWKHEKYPDTRVSEAKNFIAKHPNILFVSTGKGANSDRMGISVHKNYSDYAKYMREIKAEWAELMEITDMFVISLNSDNILRNFTFREFADYIAREESK
ncbi:MAG TPA: Lrp/AsnC family transcriptional regulator [Candidatus Acidoferrum sp.]|nr:Lrp/AsnC family transcriptional regulator [Candidatus Acidoferrum sp.]